ncbi:MAG: clan AA aspartic protease [Chloroflexota bacterium]|nr:clan AA aspartic protease [Chloroflexota bacterium]MDE2960965.1 clan AA aspartic protease [Chloroflexota bacterium]
MTHYGAVSAIDGVLEAEVAPTVLGYGGGSERVTFLVDTGATGEMTLPHGIIARLNLPLVTYGSANASVVLADGTVSVARVHTARVLWHDQVRTAEVVSFGSDPLIGMGLLRGSNLSVDAIPGGLVTITELPTLSRA